MFSMNVARGHCLRSQSLHSIRSGTSIITLLS